MNAGKDIWSTKFLGSVHLHVQWGELCPHDMIEKNSIQGSPNIRFRLSKTKNGAGGVHLSTVYNSVSYWRTALRGPRRRHRARCRFPVGIPCRMSPHGHRSPRHCPRSGTALSSTIMPASPATATATRARDCHDAELVFTVRVGRASDSFGTRPAMAASKRLEVRWHLRAYTECHRGANQCDCATRTSVPKNASNGAPQKTEERRRRQWHECHAASCL